MKNKNGIIDEIYSDIDLLYVIPCVYTRNIILGRLKRKIGLLEKICSNSIFERPLQEIERNLIPIQESPSSRNQRTFTLEELSTYDGRDGNPAYIAVNGIVYNVTNNATWAAGTHFGLQAGTDVTESFTSCHAGQPILNNLEVVGVLS
ncbi:MAG: cytochrome b5 domain-containing protein [Clostridia bacterium]|jgi:predicted heme/steroid binding protein